MSVKGHLAYVRRTNPGDAKRLDRQLAAAGVSLSTKKRKRSRGNLEAITDTVQFLATTGTPALVVLNAVSPHGHDADQTADALHTLTLDVCPVRVGHRVAFARVLLTGQATQEYDPGSKAAADVEHLHAFIMERVHKSHAVTIWSRRHQKF